MKSNQKYKIAILLLSLVIIFQWVLIVIIAKPKKIPKVPAIVKGKIAIVIDDWGYNLNNFYILDQIKYPLTASVLPNLNYSKGVAEGLHRKGIEIILHLPMEPHEKNRLEKNTIMTSMDESTIENILAEDLASVLNAKGISNHMGSRATEDLRTMEILFKGLKKRHLYFLDSFASPQSICANLARKMDVQFVKRSVFLDNKKESGYIRGQIYKLKTKARVFGQAVGVGHDQKITLEVLKEAMPELEKEGYKFVFVSEIVR